jgi:probable F420-dependent oxidoreductase
LLRLFRKPSEDFHAQPPDHLPFETATCLWLKYALSRSGVCAMKIGFSLPNIGPIGTADAITKVAQRAEALGYSSLWTIERLLYPLKLQRPYPGTPDGHLPEIYKQVLDPLDALTYVAAHTKKIKLGTSVLDMPYHNPVVLGRRLTTLDVLSNGRLLVGLGLGWNKDEMDATGADMTNRGALADEFLPLLKAIWTENPVEFQGKFFNVPRSYINLKPVQKPHPPIYLGAFVPAALKRLAKLADGWNPVFLPVPVMAEMFGTIKQMAKDRARPVCHGHGGSCRTGDHRKAARQGQGDILWFAGTDQPGCQGLCQNRGRRSLF